MLAGLRRAADARHRALPSVSWPVACAASAGGRDGAPACVAVRTVLPAWPASVLCVRRRRTISRRLFRQAHRSAAAAVASFSGRRSSASPPPSSLGWFRGGVSTARLRQRRGFALTDRLPRRPSSPDRGRSCGGTDRHDSGIGRRALACPSVWERLRPPTTDAGRQMRWRQLVVTSGSEPPSCSRFSSSVLSVSFRRRHRPSPDFALPAGSTAAADAGVGAPNSDCRGRVIGPRALGRGGIAAGARLVGSAPQCGACCREDSRASAWVVFPAASGRAGLSAFRRGRAELGARRSEQRSARRQRWIQQHLERARRLSDGAPARPSDCQDAGAA